jgi:site-specific recombinase XerD
MAGGDGDAYTITGEVPGNHLINLQKPWRRIWALAGLDDVRIHDLHQSFASFVVGAGLSLLIIGCLLGHKSVGKTARCAHLAHDPLK